MMQVMVATALIVAGGMLPLRLAAQETTADTVSLSLEEAVGRALDQSEEIGLAQSQVSLARAQVTAVRAQALPQISANLGYTRTFASSFDSGGGEEVTIPDSLRFEPDPTAPLAERVTYLEDNAQNAALGGLGGLFGDLPFGRENAYTATISGSQLLYSGGRVGAALDIARSFRESVELNLAEQVAEIELQVRSAYYQALLARELVAISEAALEQAQAFLEQEQLRLRAGRASELDVMRAEVERDNLRPPLVEVRNAAEFATLNLKRLVNLPLTQPLRLATALAPPPPAALAAPIPAPEVLAAQRASVQAAERQVAIREQEIEVAEGAFLPSVSLQMSYGRQGFPTNPFRFDTQWRTDWTAGLVVQVPIFQGFQRSAQVDLAQVGLQQAELQLSQLRESVQLQYEQARAEKERAVAAIAASQRTTEVAERVYDLTVLRYEQGLATQLEVTDARLALLQASSNQARAIADYYTADAGLTRVVAGSPGATIPSSPTVPAATEAVPQPVPVPPPGSGLSDGTR